MRRFLFCSLPLLVLAAPARAQEPPRPNEPAEVETLKPQLTLETGGHTAEILMLFFSADGRQLVSVGLDKTVRFWDVETGELRRTLRVTCDLNSLGNAQAAALSADRKTLVLNAQRGVPRGEKRALVFLDLEKGRMRKDALEVQPLGGQVFSLALSLDGKRLATGNWDGAYVWDAGTGQPLLTIQRDDGDIAGTANVVFSPDGGRLAVLMAPWVHVVELATGRHEADFKPKAYPHTLTWSPDGKTLAVTTGKGIELWDARDGTQPKASFDVGQTGSVTWVKAGRTKEGLLLTAGQQPDSRAGERGRVNLLDAASGEERHPYPLLAPGSGAGCATALSPNGKLVAAALVPDNVIHLWRRNDARLLWTAQGRGQHVVGAGWGKDGKTVAWGRSRNRAEADLANRQPLEQAFDLAGLRLIPGRPGADFQRSVLSRDGTTLNFRKLTASRDGQTTDLTVPWRPVASGTLLPGNRAAFGSTLGPLYLVDTQTGKMLHNLRGHSSGVLDLAPSPDGRYLVSAGKDQTLRVWDVATPGKEALLLSLFVAGQDWIVWTPGGYYAATPGGEKLMGWMVKPGHGQLATFYPAERFRKQLHRPDVIKLVLEKGSVEEALKAAGVQGADVEQLLPPRATLELVETNLPKVKVKATAEAAARGQPVRSLRLLVDGRPLPDGAGVLDLKEGRAKAEKEWEVELPPGPHELKALARAPDTAGASAGVTLDVPAATASDRPTLHLIAVGIDAYPQQALQLRCAVSDARGLAEAFGQHCAGPGNLFGAAKVKTLLNGQATRPAILAALKDVRQAVRPGDLLVFSFAGHGARQGKQFYLLTHDADPDKLADTALSGDDLRAALADLPCQVLLLLDACHSAAGVRAFIDEAARGLTDDETGVAVLCAAMGYEEAQEKDGHGLFTQAVMDALKGGDGVPFNRQDRRQYVHHLGSFVLDEVQAASHDAQHPFLTLPYVTESFPVRQLPGAPATGR